jgi:hypothetical protein
MVRPVEAIVVCNREYKDRIKFGIDERTTGLVVKNTLNPSAIQGETDLSETDCIITVNLKEGAPAEASFEYLRENHPDSQIVVVSNKDNNIDLIEEIITDELSEYVFAPEETIPFGLLSVRCKRLVSESNSY